MAAEAVRQKFWLHHQNEQDPTPQDRRIERDLWERLFTQDQPVPQASRSSPATPEKNLWLSVLWDAMHIYLSTGAGGYKLPSPKLVSEAAEWIEGSDDEDTAIGSFTFVCQVLQFNPSWLRKLLVEERLRRLAK